ncbi:diheme cytochrome c-553 [Snuella lapsa]|uniref:Cytochrome c domain-containing protein n=1 Tax=Snuella lapsa TaxID=870481 RepID=A0ABP6Y8C3_9FLAO
MKTNYFVAATFAVLCITMYACNSTNKEKKEAENYETIEEVTPDPIKRGEQLVNAIGCHDCHTPKKFTEHGIALNTDLLLSGHPADEELAEYDPKTAQSYILFTMGLTAVKGPWGTSFAANLTPDDSGIGTWSEDQFLTAIKKGLYKGIEGSRPLLPPMPWESYRNLPDEDLKAIFAYLKSIPPVNNTVPAALPPQMQ